MSGIYILIREHKEILSKFGMILKHKGMIPKTNVDIDLAILYFKMKIKLHFLPLPRVI